MRDRKADPFYPPDDVFWVWKPDPWTTHRQTRPLTWLAVHLCPTAAWVSGWWTLLGCRAGDRRLRVNPCPRHRVCTPPPHPLTRSSPSSLGNSQPPPPPPLLPLAATEPGKAVVAPPVLLFHLPTPPLLLLHARTHTCCRCSLVTASAAAPCKWHPNCAVCPFQPPPTPPPPLVFLSVVHPHLCVNPPWWGMSFRTSFHFNISSPPEFPESRVELIFCLSGDTAYHVKISLLLRAGFNQNVLKGSSTVQ